MTRKTLEVSLAAANISINEAAIALNRTALKTIVRARSLTCADCRQVIICMRDAAAGLASTVGFWEAALSRDEPGICRRAQNTLHDLNQAHSALTTVRDRLPAGEPPSRCAVTAAAMTASRLCAPKGPWPAGTAADDHIMFASQLDLALASMSAVCVNIAADLEELRGDGTVRRDIPALLREAAGAASRSAVSATMARADLEAAHP